jgi:hypothetical protein
MAAVLTADLGDGAPVRVSCRAMMRSPSRITCTHALMSTRCEQTPGKFSRCQPVCKRGAQPAELGAGERIRTADLPFTRRLLCLLSYTGGRL